MTTSTYAGLVQLFNDWREFERPPMRAGAPDYSSEYLDQAYLDFKAYRARLMAMDIADWPVEQQADWHVVRAEMNGFDFNYRVLKPWARDPAFYQTVMTERSDVPDHAGPTHHAVIDLWAYRFPLSDGEQQRLVRQLQVIPPLMIQARDNLTGNARDLWIAGMRNIHRQSEDLDGLLLRVGTDASAELEGAIADARRATDDLAEWLEEQAPAKTGPSGVGKDNYT
ncbi:MAG: hypothetical protein ACREQ1_00480, partial [Woeseiaceae bacterium]